MMEPNGSKCSTYPIITKLHVSNRTILLITDIEASERKTRV